MAIARPPRGSPLGSVHNLLHDLRRHDGTRRQLRDAPAAVAPGAGASTTAKAVHAVTRAAAEVAGLGPWRHASQRRVLEVDAAVHTHTQHEDQGARSKGRDTTSQRRRRGAGESPERGGQSEIGGLIGDRRAHRVQGGGLLACQHTGHISSCRTRIAMASRCNSPLGSQTWTRAQSPRRPWP